MLETLVIEGSQIAYRMDKTKMCVSVSVGRSDVCTFLLSTYLGIRAVDFLATHRALNEISSLQSKKTSSIPPFGIINIMSIEQDA